MAENLLPKDALRKWEYLPINTQSGASMDKAEKNYIRIDRDNGIIDINLNFTSLGSNNPAGAITNILTVTPVPDSIMKEIQEDMDIHIGFMICQYPNGKGTTPGNMTIIPAGFYTPAKNVLLLFSVGQVGSIYSTLHFNFYYK